MAYGTRFEDNAAADFLFRAPKCIGLEASILQHPSIDYLASSPDGTIQIHDPVHNTFDVVAFEIKCPSMKLDKRSGIWKHKSISSPIWYYLPQVIMEMVATGTTAAIFQVWNCERHKYWYIPWNDAFYQKMLTLVAAFKDDSVSYAEFTYLKNILTQYAKLICKDCPAIHHKHRRGFVSKYVDGDFSFDS